MSAVFKTRYRAQEYSSADPVKTRIGQLSYVPVNAHPSIRAASSVCKSSSLPLSLLGIVSGAHSLPNKMHVSCDHYFWTHIDVLQFDVSRKWAAVSAILKTTNPAVGPVLSLVS